MTQGISDSDSLAALSGDDAGRLLINGKWIAGADRTEVIDKFDLEPFAVVHVPDQTQIDAALAAAKRAAQHVRTSNYERFEFLSKAAVLVGQHQEHFVELMARETGFPRKDALGEVSRAVQTLTLSAEEARRLSGEVVPMDGAPTGKGRIAFTLRVPIGVVVAITPFNSPLNTVCHKLGPALAAGNAVILKPAAATPLTATLLCRLLCEAGVPAGMLTLLHGSGSTVGKALVADPRADYFTFTGSTEVGKTIQALAGLRRTQMELGSIAATIVCEDAELGGAVSKIAGASFRKAGQVCTSIQLLYVHRSRHEELVARLLADTAKFVVGDPKDGATDVGPLISQREAERVAAWIAGARSDGARLLVGGERDRAVVTPTVIAETTPEMRVRNEEIFGPAVNVISFDDPRHAFADINRLPFGLATGIFTNDLSLAFEAARTLIVGGVHVNETSSSRVDLMPYGGSKLSGFGREGPAYAIHEMTEERIVTFTPASS